MTEHKSYLGDGVYVRTDGVHVILTAEDGISATNTVYLEPQVMDGLITWYQNLLASFKEGGGE